MFNCKQILHSLLLILLLLIIWQVTSDLVNDQRLIAGKTGLEAFIPSPITIGKTFVESGNLIFSESLFTIYRALLGLVIGVSVAVVIALLFFLIPVLRGTAFPIMYALNSFPIVGIAPAVVLAFGQGSLISIVFISALVCYFPTLITLDTAFRNVSQETLDLMRVFNASRFQIFRLIRIPQSLPYVFMALKIAVPGSIIGATMGEWLGARNGLGQLITVSLYQLKPGLLYAALLFIVLITLTIVLLISIIERYLIPWKYIKN